MSDLRRAAKNLLAPILLFVIVFTVSLAVSLGRHRLDHVPSFEEGGIAFHLLRGDGFLSPLLASPLAPPSSYCAPIYPILIAGAYELTSFDSRAACTLLLMLNSICFAWTSVSLFRLGRFYTNATAGFIAGIIPLAHPCFLFYVGNYWDTFVAMAIFFWIVADAAMIPSRPFSLARWILMGVAFGVLSLTSVSYTLAYPLLVLIACGKYPIPKKLASIFIASGVWLIVISPWVIRDIRAFHRLYYVRDELNFELSFGNQTGATGWMDASLASASPWFNGSERSQLLWLGEPKYFDLCRSRFEEEYMSSPADFWLRVGRRIAYIFISDPTQGQLDFPLFVDTQWRGYVVDRVIVHGLLAVFGVAGVWASMRLRLRCAWIFLAAILAEVPFMVTTVDDRYALPIRATLIFFAVMLGWSFVMRTRWRHRGSAVIPLPASAYPE